MSPEAREVLLAARAIIEDRWCQGTVRRELPDGTTQHCIVGAIWQAAPTSRAASARGAVEGLLSLRAGVSLGALHTWNDKPGRTRDEVLALFDSALEAV